MTVIKTSIKGIEQQLYSLYHIVFLKYEKYHSQTKNSFKGRRLQRKLTEVCQEQKAKEASRRCKTSPANGMIN
ncbi:hypothetical protein [Enterococcus casseliflavus]|uniref:hypothetical protein n=1 Tax=Enterococcus casseliflavus TaxID=37734 RepID=UPI001AD661D6|nr:hypothetical protein [Enterococcus casseliflavus]